MAVRRLHGSEPATSSEPSGVPLRAIALGVLLLPVNAFWLVQMELAGSGGAHDTRNAGPYVSTLSLFANVICFLVGLAAFNALVRRRRPAWALTQSEMLIVYIMLTIGTCLASIDFLDVLFPMLGHPVHYATASNGWHDLFIKFLPPWFYVRDEAALKGWYDGNANPYAWTNLRAWLLPLAGWGGFILVLYFVMLCMNVLLREQWTRHERLSYPVIQLPLQLTEPSGAFFRQPVMWAGFAISGSISLLNGLAVLYPNIPSVPIKAVDTDLARFFPNPPWNAMGWTPMGFYPFAIGIAYLLPTDMLFSCWFFCLMWRVERIVSAAYGWSEWSPSYPYVNEQSFGAYMGVAAIALWGARRHLAAVVREAWVRGWRRDRDAPMSYRGALLGALAGISLLIGFFHYSGLPLWVAVVAFLIYFSIAIACTRMRAELGPPAHDLHQGSPDYMLTAIFGTHAFSARALTSLTYFYWFNRAYRSIAMPYQLEAFKIGERRNLSSRGISAALLIASAVGLLSGYWAMLHIPYHVGAEARMAHHLTYFGVEAFSRLEGWLHSPRQTDVPAVLAAALGVGITLALHMARMRLGWFPFHPLGFAVSGSFSMSTLWMPVFIAWVCKSLVLRYKGLAGYRRAMPFFLGITLGDYLVGCAWPLYGWLFGVNVYCYYH